ncbi:hypothetical protein J7E52_16895 [Bacillus sp. ISL-34]|uniref:hypothetical protein n=1 Tax=Bacillus sp. ISL-34 TaxID=2819121 RepID=UPI001BE87EE9|nr:hypothetical protein [Bacillus sp. ISL-34]MBT2648349.1 hypothetical protein [Bacillus sp. ISL-34]
MDGRINCGEGRKKCMDGRIKSGEGRKNGSGGRKDHGDGFNGTYARIKAKQTPNGCIGLPNRI